MGLGSDALSPVIDLECVVVRETPTETGIIGLGFRFRVFWF